MGSDFSVRIDTMLAEQRDVFAYWSELPRIGSIPARSAFSPAPIVRHLPMVSMIDVIDGGEAFRFRLAGTGLRAIYGQDLTGRALEQAPVQADYWRDVYRRIAQSGTPGQGFVSVRHPDRATMIQAWLRLPLCDDGGNTTVILGFDRFLPVEKLAARAPAPFAGTAMPPPPITQMRSVAAGA